MTESILFIRSMLLGFFNFLNSISFHINGMNISYLSIILGSLAISFVISFFWKGARG